MATSLPFSEQLIEKFRIVKGTLFIKTYRKINYLYFAMIKGMRFLHSLLAAIKKNRAEFIVVLFIILVALSIRLYRIDEYMMFLGDEGRDMLIMKKIWIEHDLPFIGPPTSVGNMYLGPLYYYMMAIPTGIFWMNPVAASAMIALFGTATVGFIYYLSRMWFGKVAAVVSAILYALSPVNIVYSQSSWNPNPAPFFALVSLYGLFKVHRSGNMYWLIVTGVGLAFSIQMHYLALLLLPVMGLLWIYELLLHYRGKLKRTNIWQGTGGAAMVFLLLMSPLFVFDLKHDFPNFHAFVKLITGDASALGTTPINPIVRIWQIFSDLLVSRYFGVDQGIVLVIVSTLIVLPFVWVGILKIRGKRLSWPYLGIGVWLLVGILGLTQYKNSIYDHYLGFLNPAPFMLFGALGGLICGIKKTGLKVGAFIVYSLTVFLILGIIVFCCFEIGNQLLVLLG